MDSYPNRISASMLQVIISVFFAALLSLLFWKLFSSPGSDSQIQVQSKKLERNIFWAVHDFDHDNFSENVYFKYEPNSERWGIKISHYDESIIDQWNLPEPWFRQAIFGDFDNDLWDELYFFTYTEDSLFLWAIDPRHRNRFLLQRQLMAVAPNPLPPGASRWDINDINGTLLDCDGDGFKDLVLSFYTGFALQPRCLLTYSIKKQKVLQQTPPLGIGGLGAPQVFQPPGRTIPIIVLNRNYATDNYTQSIPLRDDRAWLIAFSPELKFLFPPVAFPPVFSSVSVKPVLFSTTPYLVVLHTVSSPSNQPRILYLYTLDGQEVTRRQLSRDFDWYISSLPTGRFNRLYLSNNQGSLQLLDEQLHTVKEFHFPHPLKTFLAEGDFDGDLENEYCFESQGGSGGQAGVVILETDFEAEYFYPLQLSYPIKTYHFLQGEDVHQLLLWTSEQCYLLRYTLNPHAKLLQLIPILLFLLLSTGIYLVLRSQQQRRLLHCNWQTAWKETENGFLILDDQGRSIDANARFVSITGIDPQAVKGTPVNQLLARHPKLLEFVTQLQEKKQPRQQVLPVTRLNRKQKLEVEGIPIFGPFRVSLGYQLRLREQNQMNEFPEQVRRWGETVRRIAHDIKTPLSAIQLSLKTLQYKIQDTHPDSSEELNEEFKQIYDEIQRVAQLSRHFIRFVNVDKPQKEIVFFPELLQRVFAHLHRHLNNEKIEIESELDPECNTLEADPRQLEMLFQILLENSIEALSEGGRILIQTTLAQYLDNPEVEYVEIDVADTGPGIDPEIGEKVFEPYFTTKKDGSGLGLTIARKIVEDHGGKITLSSRPGFATIFKIMLPKGNCEHDEESPDTGSG